VFTTAVENGKRLDFEVEKCKSLPELLEKDDRNGVGGPARQSSSFGG
jgi:hypothetical protein